jgi:hypothetical protein
MNVNSLTKLHSISPGDLEKLQLSAAKIPFEEQSERIALVKELAGAQRIASIENADDLVPLPKAVRLMFALASSYRAALPDRHALRSGGRGGSR